MRRISFLSRMGAWFRAATFRQRFERDMDEELRFHLQEHEQELIAKGLPRAEARRQARIDFGGAEASRAGIRSALGLRLLDDLLADLRYACRVLRSSPGFTVIAAGSLALAIGANTTIFSVAQFMLLERLKVPRASELRVLYREDGGHSVYHSDWGDSFRADNGDFVSDSFTYPVARLMQQTMHDTGVELFTFKDLSNLNVSFGQTAESVRGQLVSGNFYSQMQTSPILGRGILSSDDGAPGTGAVAVLSYSFWQSAFGGSPAALGRVIRVDTTPITIVGVNAKGFTGAEGAQRSPELFMPMSMIAAFHGSLGRHKVLESNQLNWIQVMLRKPSSTTDMMLRVTLEQSFHAAVLATVSPKAGEVVSRLLVEGGSRGLAESARALRKPIYVLLGLVGCVLLLACVNIANLMLARAYNRQREVGVRLALGATRSRVFRQLLVESLMLATLGGLVGLTLGYLGTTASSNLVRLPWERTATVIPFQWPVLVFTASITMLTGILFGLAPAWRSTQTDVNTALKQGARSASRQRRAWSGKGLVAFQVAIATLLVSCSALFFRTMLKLSEVPTGFEPTGLLIFQVQPPTKRYAGQKSLMLHEHLLQRFAGVPGVEGVAAASVPLISNSRWNSSVRLEGEPSETKTGERYHGQSAFVDDVSPNFFSVMPIPVIAGRRFGAGDTATTPRVAVINQAFAKQFFAGKDPLGLRITADEEEVDGKRVPVWLTIVGICGDSQYSDLRTAPNPILFTDKFQSKVEAGTVMEASYIVRSHLAASGLTSSLRKAASEIDADVPLANIRTQVEQIADVSRQERLFATLTAGFGLLALILACVGIYGVMAYTVSQRTHEIGIRLALGADRKRVRSMVLREAMSLAALGISVGIAATLGLAQLVRSLLYHLQPHDPLSLALAAVLLMFVAVTSGWLPAARAARLEPMLALRQD